MYIYIHVCVCPGDQVSRKGTMTGGYIDTRRSRLETQRQMTEQRKRLEDAEAEQAQLRYQLDHIPLSLSLCFPVCVCVCLVVCLNSRTQLDGKLTRVLGDLQRTETKQIQLKYASHILLCCILGVCVYTNLLF